MPRIKTCATTVHDGEHNNTQPCEHETTRLRAAASTHFLGNHHEAPPMGRSVGQAAGAAADCTERPGGASGTAVLVVALLVCACWSKHDNVENPCRCLCFATRLHMTKSFSRRRTKKQFVHMSFKALRTFIFYQIGLLFGPPNLTNERKKKTEPTYLR